MSDVLRPVKVTAPSDEGAYKMNKNIYIGKGNYIFWDLWSQGNDTGKYLNTDTVAEERHHFQIFNTVLALTKWLLVTFFSVNAV